MQTFLPHPNFAESARLLDPRRLGKQRVEALQVWRGLTVAGYGWRHHPVVKMWRGYAEALVRYGLAMCEVWVAPGRRDTVAATLLAEYADAIARGQVAGEPVVRGQHELAAAGHLPAWLGSEDLHRSHRSALRRKDPAYYGPLFPDDPDDLPYVWPEPDVLPE
jgi:hypothetical protein